MESSIRALLTDAIQQKVTPGISVGVLNGLETTFINEGTTTYESSALVNEDTVYDVASITKSIPLGTLAAIALDAGLCSLDDTVAKHLPNMQSETFSKVTIEHLLTYTAIWDIPGGLSQHGRIGGDAVLRAIQDSPLLHPPGKQYFYTNTPALLLGLIVEQLFGDRIDVVAQKQIFSPLHMEHTSFNPDVNGHLVAPSERDPSRGEVLGTVHDESAAALQSIGIVPGHAGLFSTSFDMISFAKQYCSGQGVFNESIQQMFETNATPHLATPAGLGWELAIERFTTNHQHDGIIYKTGFTGCFILIDRAHQRGVSVMMNAQHPTRHNDKIAVDALRKAITETILN